MEQRDERVADAIASVTIDASLPRRLLPAGLVAAWFAVVVGVAVALGRGTDAAGAAIIPLIAIAVYSAWVLHQRRQPVLVLDHDGIRGRSGAGIAWRDAALVWIGYEGALGSPVVRIWDQPSLTLALRSGARPEERFRCWVTAAITADQLVTIVRGFTAVPIRTGKDASYRRLIKELRGQHLPVTPSAGAEALPTDAGAR